MERGVEGGRPPAAAAASTAWLPLGDDCRLGVRASAGVMMSAADSVLLSEGAGLSGRHPATAVGVSGSCSS